ncbi:MAG: SDR family oxidoreductase [Chlorobiaceae bacterium]|nr:SDR family oxidoreductase [Chlorobiaceae bacterium]NTV60784.1 SDR family oxidoreductase [Chlorobiaceae bacterium]
MQKESISILGCGWLGLPLARDLVREGYRVRGSTTGESKLEQLRDAGVEPFIIRLDPEASGDDITDFLQSDILLVDIPPARRDDILEYHIAQFSSLIDALSQSTVRSVLLVSSTSVYPACNREVVEEESAGPESLSGQVLLMVEEMMMSETGFQTTVVRFGGLVGYDRNPAAYAGLLKETTDPDQPMNLIHRDDCVKIIMEIIRLGQWGEIFNACAPVHPLKGEYYRRAAEKSGLPLPSMAKAEIPCPYKIVNSDKLLKALHYVFLHPDPLEG